MIAGLALAVGLSASLSGCVSMVIGGVASAGVAASEERGLGGALTDTRIRTDINGKWLNASMDMLQKVDLSVNEGRVLLTGTVPTQEMRLEAVKLVWQVDGVREVNNEIKVGEGSGATDYARDVWISTQLRSALLFDGGIQSVNYSVETVDGTVYLMGVAQNQTELDRATNHARNLRYVKRVVSYMRIKGQPSGGTTTQAGRPPAAPPSSNAGSSPLPAEPPPAAGPSRAPIETAPLSAPGNPS